ncbi:MAG: RND transporter, partial [Ferruginibacter sp.]|nr:RND transporter [Ferruginibacter sp.]
MSFFMLCVDNKKWVVSKNQLSLQTKKYFQLQYSYFMWKSLAKFVLKNRLVLLFALIISTAVMGYYASKVELSYEFSRAIPSDNPKLREYQSFKKIFGNDGNIIVIGIQDTQLFKLSSFKSYKQFCNDVRNVKNVEDILSVSDAVEVYKPEPTEDEIMQELMGGSVSEKKELASRKIFSDSIHSQSALDSAKTIFYQQPLYRALMYNPETHAYLIGVKVNKDSINSSARVAIINDIQKAVDNYRSATKIDVYVSGLPFIRTVIAERVQDEMKLFLLGSLMLSVLILFLFFRSISTTLISISVVIIGVVWTVALIYLCGYKITLLTALIPSLVVVIGIPNCIYFINKYHSSYLNNPQTDDKLRKREALIDMVSKMGIVTLFCNITAAIGFAVFAFTKSDILKEFGVVSGFSIMIIFVISFILLPAVLSYLPSPKKNQLKYLQSKWVGNFLSRIESWVFHHKKWVLSATMLIVIVAVLGIFRLNSVAYIVDDLPKTDKVYKDLKFFETHFRGIMPLEILIDSKMPKVGLRKKGYALFQKLDSLSAYI